MALLTRNKVFVTLLLGSIVLYAQKTPSPDDIRYNSYRTMLSFVLKEGRPVAHYSVKREVEYLSDKKTGLNSLSVWYSDYYSEGHRWEASAHLPRKKAGKYKSRKLKYSSKNRVTSEGIFYEDVTRETFYFGELSPGSLTRLSYSYTIKDPVLVPKIVFNEFLFSKEIVATIAVPDYMSVKLVLKGDSSAIVRTVSRIPGQTVYTYSCVNRQGIEQDENAVSLWYHVPHLLVIPVSCVTPKDTVQLAGTVPALFKRYVSSLREMSAWDTLAVKRISDSITAGIADTLQKVGAVYKWVQSNIRYIAFEDGRHGFVPRAPDKVLKNRYGDCKDMATLQVHLLAASGVPAYHAWIGTRRFPYRYEEVPSPHCDDHMIAATRVGGKYIVLDATSPVNQLGFPTAFIQGKEALLRLDNERYEIVSVPVMPEHSSVHYDSLTISVSKDRLIGSGRRRVSGYIRDEYRNSLKRPGGESELLGKIALGNNKTLIRGFKLDGSTVNAPEMVMNYQIELPDYAAFFNNEVYVNMHLSKAFHNEHIDTEKTRWPLENNYHYSMRERVLLHIPDDMQIGKLPADRSFSNRDFSFDIRYSVSGNQLVLDKAIRLTHLVLEPEQFGEWNRMIDELAGIYSEAVVLTKKTK